MPRPIPSAALCATAALLLGACTPHVDLGSRHRAYDHQWDLAARGGAVLQQDDALLADLQAHTQTPDAEPYGQLAADVETMRRKALDLARSADALRAMLAELDALAPGRAALSQDDGPPWVDYQDLEARYRPMAEAAEQERSALDGAHQDFQSLLRRYGVDHEQASAVGAEADSLTGALDKALGGMETRLQEDRALYENLRLAGGQPKELMRLRRRTLDGLEQELLDAEAFQRKAAAAARAVKDELPASGDLYTGPGMPGDGRAVTAMRDDRDELEQRHMAFDEGCRHFEHIDSEPYDESPTGLQFSPTPVPEAAQP